MPDSNSKPPAQAAQRSNEYPIRTPAATHSLERILHDRIAGGGPMRFPEFMAAALYEPTLGYYAHGTRQVGRSGDFFTSVSVGPLFGELLARRFLREWRETGAPNRWRIIECGAHDGTLASDVLGALRILNPSAFAALEYVIPEPLPQLQAAQQKTLRPFAGRVRFLENLEPAIADPLPGIAFGNELLDALPFHIVEWHGHGWVECLVALAPAGGFIWETGAIRDPLLEAALHPLGHDFPHGYRTEVRTCVHAFLEPLARSLESGLMVWADYGFEQPEYYHPGRTSGTMRTFSKHRAGENPLAYPGELDITAHVDFTAVAQTAASLGGRTTAFQNQGCWLTGTARDWLLDQEGNPQASALRQFQTLTHPAHLGGCFHVLELSWKATATADEPTILQRLR